jgi:cytidine deaminase
MNPLLKKASEAMKKAYAPYSRFKVGSAVRAGSGKIYLGCNVENASYGATICAERVAISQAIAAGEKTITEIGLINSTGRPCTPCGICLQVIAEFGRDAKIYSTNKNLKKVESYTLKDLLPHAYDDSYLK